MQLKDYWQDIYSKTHHKGLAYKISFTGGEVTGNKDFLPFLRWLRSDYGDKLHSILISTNGSASYKYYEKMYQLVDNISFSVHSEHVHETKFFDMIIKLKKNIINNKFVHVNIMDEYWNKDRIAMYESLLKDHNISYSVCTVHMDNPIRQFPMLKGKLDLEI